jgi:cytochrome bd-type quinol oxidase subunit 2
LEIIPCDRCRLKVLPKQDGTCPSCGQRLLAVDSHSAVLPETTSPVAVSHSTGNRSHRLTHVALTVTFFTLAVVLVIAAIALAAGAGGRGAESLQALAKIVMAPLLAGLLYLGFRSLHKARGRGASKKRFEDMFSSPRMQLFGRRIQIAGMAFVVLCCLSIGIWALLHRQ